MARFETEKGKPYIERSSTVSQLGRFRNDDCARFLEEVYRKDADLAIRHLALTTLGTVGSPHARTVLMEVATKEPDTSMKSAAVQALAGLRPPPERSFFEQMAAPSQDILTRQAAIRGLGSLGDLDSARSLLKLLEAPATKPGTARPDMINNVIIAELKRFKGKGLGTLLAEELGKGRETWLKQILLALLTALEEAGEHAAVVLKLSRDPDPELRAAAAYALDSDPLTEAALARLIDMLQDKVDAVAAAAATVLGKRAPEKARAALIKAAGSKEVGRATAALAALGGYPDDSAAQATLKKALKKKQPWQLPAAAIAALERCRHKESIEALVAALDKLEGRLQADACRALEKLTGQDIGNDIKAWQTWWKAAGKGFTLPSEAELAKRDKPKERGATVSRNPQYYGTEVVSKRITFIVDFSGSMSAKMNRDDPKSPTRLEKAKEELSNVVKTLDKDVFFNLMFFGTSFKTWQANLSKATPQVRKVALEFIDKGGSMGGTNIYDPLEKAMEDVNVDTIYLLSDGAPGNGKFTIPADILREISKLNTTRRIVIHTISFGAKSSFLKDLAEQNGGTYVER